MAGSLRHWQHPSLALPVAVWHCHWQWQAAPLAAVAVAKLVRVTVACTLPCMLDRVESSDAGAFATVASNAVRHFVGSHSTTERPPLFEHGRSVVELKIRTILLCSRSSFLYAGDRRDLLVFTIFHTHVPQTPSVYEHTDKVILGCYDLVQEGRILLRSSKPE